MGDILDRPLVSVIVPTRDRNSLLLEAIHSVLEQQYRPLEVVVVNDGGAAVKNNLLACLAVETDTIQVVELPRSLGPAGARHEGLCHARGAIVAYLDDDDIYYPGHIEGLVAALVDTDDSPPLAYSDAEHLLFEGHAEKWQKTHRMPMPGRSYDEALLQIVNYIPLICVGHTRERYFQVGGFNPRLPCLEDWELLIRLTRGLGATHIPRITAAYRHFEGIERVNTLREDGLEVMQQIYAAHPVCPSLQAYRDQHLRELAQKIRLFNRQKAQRAVKPRLARVSRALSSGQARVAERLLNELIEDLPNDGELLLMLSKIMRLTHRPKMAEHLSQQARQRDPYLFTP